MYCQECHRQVPSDSRYCHYCGVRLALPVSGRPIANDNPWEREWQRGSPLSQPELQRRTPSSVTSDELARRPRHRRAVILTLAMTLIVALGVGVAFLHTPVFAALNLPDITLPLQKQQSIPTATPPPTIVSQQHHLVIPLP